jgi:hypothetical protein
MTQHIGAEGIAGGCDAPVIPAARSEDTPRCQRRWKTPDPCEVHPSGVHVCWRSDSVDHRTHMCDCDRMLLPESSPLDTARSVLGLHVSDQDGMCAGCLALWGRLIFHRDCPQAQWAHRVVDAHSRIRTRVPMSEL